jgi:hypothetical protein
MSASSNTEQCLKMITNESYGYSIPKMIQAYNNSNELINLVYNNFSLPLEPPISISDFVSEINYSLNPSIRFQPYTFCIIDVENILFLSIFKKEFKTTIVNIFEDEDEKTVDIIDKHSEVGEHILMTIMDLFHQYIVVGSDGKYYLTFLRVVGSHFELFNKHGSFVAFMKNKMLEHLCDYIEESSLVNRDDFDSEFYDLFYHFGSAGEFLISKAATNRYYLNYNFFSGTLMRKEYNTVSRIKYTKSVLDSIINELNSSFYYKPNYVDKQQLIPRKMDSTNDAISLINRGVKLYVIDNDLYNGYIKQNFITLFTRLRMAVQTLNTMINIFKIKNELSLKLIHLMKNMNSKTISTEFLLELERNIEELQSVISEDKKIRLQKSIMNLNKTIQNMRNYFILKDEINTVVDRTEPISIGDLKRVRGVKTGGKKKKTHKYKKNKKKHKRKTQRGK